MTMVMSPVNARSVARFKAAQDRAWPRIAREIAVGRKRTHWMWFVFPQLRALAKSETAQYYGLRDREEALAYLDDPVLRTRLYESTKAILGHRRLMFSHPDDRKLRSSMTLFSQVVIDPTLPNAVLAKFYNGQPDQLTLGVLAGKPIPQQWTAQGRVEVGRHWDKQIERARRAVASAGVPLDPTEPMSRDQVESFVKGFGLSAAATRRLVMAWMADQARAWAAGEESHADSAWYDEG